MQKQLINYSETPQVTALEYHEMQDLKVHPEKADYYRRLAEQRRFAAHADYKRG